MRGDRPSDHVPCILPKFWVGIIGNSVEQVGLLFLDFLPSFLGKRGAWCCVGVLLNSVVTLVGY